MHLAVITRLHGYDDYFAKYAASRVEQSQCFAYVFSFTKRKFLRSAKYRITYLALMIAIGII